MQPYNNNSLQVHELLRSLLDVRVCIYKREEASGGWLGRCNSKERTRATSFAREEKVLLHLGRPLHTLQ